MDSPLRLFKLVFMLVLTGIGTGALADDASASHYRGGAMVPRVNASGQLTITTTTYWRKDLTSAAMPALSGVPLPQSSKSTDTSDSRFNAVVQTHTGQLPSPGTYTITWGGSARVGGINNAAEAGWQLTSKLYWDGSAANIPIYFDLGAVQPEVVAGESYAGSLGAVAGSGATLTYDQALALSINSQPPGFAINCPAKTKPFAWRNFLPRASVRVVRGSTFVWLRVADRAGNISSWMKVPLGKQVVKTKKPAEQKAPAGG